MSQCKTLLLASLVAMIALAGSSPGWTEEADAATKLQFEPGSDEAVLLERATEYWKHRVKQDPEVLEFYPPQELHPEGSIVPEGGAIAFESFEIQSVQVDGERGIVTVTSQGLMTGETPFPIPKSVLLRTDPEIWMKTDGVWLKQPVIPAMAAVADDLQRAFKRRQQQQAEEAPKQPGEGETPTDGSASQGTAAE